MSRKLSPYEAFVDNIEDAESLLIYAHAFQNRRARSMRSELRSRIGEALKVAVTRQNELDCLESDDLFVVFKPDSRLGRAEFTDLRPTTPSSFSRCEYSSRDVRGGQSNGLRWPCPLGWQNAAPS